MISRFSFTFTTSDFFKSLSFSTAYPSSSGAEIKKYFGGREPHFVNKARIGIRISLQSLELKKGSKIGVQPLTCHSVLLAIINSGYNPVFIDIDENFKLSRKDILEKKDIIDALIVTHLFGYPEDVHALKKIFTKPIVEDCAQALFSKIDNQSVGLLGYSGVFSIGYGKLLGIGDGGFIISSTPEVNIKIKEYLKGLSKSKKYQIFFGSFKNLVLGFLHKPCIYKYFTFPLKNSLSTYKTGLQDYPKRETTGNQSVVNLFGHKFIENQLKIRKQQENGKLLSTLIDNRFSPIQFTERCEPNFFLVPIKCKNRDQLIDHMIVKGIEASKHFYKSYQWIQGYGYILGSCPVFEKLIQEIITVPCHHNLTKEQIHHIANTINDFQ